MKKFELGMAIRYLSSSKKEGFVSIITIFSFLGIFLGVTVLILVTSFFSGFRHELIKSFVGIDGHVTIYGARGEINNYKKVVQDIQQLDDVVKVRPVIENFSLISFDGTSAPATIRAYQKDDLKQIPDFMKSLNIQTIDQLDDVSTEEKLPHIIIGESLAYKIGVFEPGARVSLTGTHLTQTAFGAAPSSTDFLVTGIFRTGNIRYDDFYVLLSFQNASWFLGMNDHASKIDVFATHISDAEKIEKQLVEQNMEDVYVSSWRRNYGSIVGAIDVERNVAFIIVGLVILIAAFSIISSLIMLVNGKVRDIGILRTQGATRKQIRNIFIISGSLIGIVGTISGIFFGVLFSLTAESIRLFLNQTFHLNLFPAEVFNMSALPTEVDPLSVVFIGVATILLTILASLYPAYRASLIDPAEALKYE